MLDSSRLLPLALHLPVWFSGAGIHRAALRALSRERWDEAEVLFEAAAARYRADLQVEPLARLRVHQSIARIRSGVLAGEARAHRVLEVERGLSRLDLIESLEPPFEMMPARELLASWLPAETAGISRAA